MRNFVPEKMNGEVPKISISKEAVSSMDAVEYPGGIEAVTVIDSVAKARIALRALRKCKHIGFDTETRPSFRRGHMNKVALLQLSSGSHCYLFRLNMPGIFEAAKPLLEDPESMTTTTRCVVEAKLIRPDFWTCKTMRALSILRIYRYRKYMP